MTRECKLDFKSLTAYISEYSLDKNIGNDKYFNNLKKMHKVYFSAVTWNIEMIHNTDIFTQCFSNCNEDSINRISESVSDFGSSLFNWMNGGYKVSRVMLRVGIENFIRGIGSINDKSILTEKSVYALFDNAKQLPIFNTSETIKSAFYQLHSDYKLLCKDTHTAGNGNMAQLSTLSGLPIFKDKKAKDSSEVFIRILKQTTYIFCLIFSSFYHQLHHRSKENILHSVERKVKPMFAGAV
jgi:hypothetical protein